MNQLGYYGKAPQRGDFVRFNLPRTFVTVWDDWLQQIMIQGESHGQDWASLYASAPAYRFILSSGIAGNTPWMGLMRASADKVGRRFPFCLAMSLPETALPCHSAVSRCLWFDEADSLLDRVLSRDYDFEQLQDDLTMLVQHAPPPDNATVDPVTISARDTSDKLTISLSPSACMGECDTLAPLLDTVLRQTLGEYSLWLGREPAQTSVLNSGLPSDAAGLALFMSDWGQASTAQIDLGALRSNQREDNTAANTEPVIHSTLPAEHSDRPISEADGWATDTTLAAATADDWAALEDFKPVTDPYAEVIVPEVEPLELDEDDLPDAPWEK